MKYAFLIYANEGDNDESPEMMGRWADFTQRAHESGALSAGEALYPIAMAQTVRVRNGQPSITDGPFAETREQLGGFYVLECADLDAAIEWAKRIPSVDWGSIEIRPVMDFSQEM